MLAQECNLLLEQRKLAAGCCATLFCNVARHLGSVPRRFGRVAGLACHLELMLDPRELPYEQGRLTVDDRAGMEAVACECYGVVRQAFREVLGVDRG